MIYIIAYFKKKEYNTTELCKNGVDFLMFSVMVNLLEAMIYGSS